MEVVLGIKGKECVVLASDTMMVNGIILIKDDLSKIHRISEHSMAAAIGNRDDSKMVLRHVQEKSNLYELDVECPMLHSTMAHVARNSLADTIRIYPQCDVSMLLASCNFEEGPHLSSIDGFDSINNVNYSGHGLGYLVASNVFDTLWRPNLSLDECVDIIRLCVRRIHKRLIFNLRNFEIFVVDFNGVREIENYKMSVM